jgi:hypothetical protein
MRKKREEQQVLEGRLVLSIYNQKTNHEYSTVMAASSNRTCAGLLQKERRYAYSAVTCGSGCCDRLNQRPSPPKKGCQNTNTLRSGVVAGI